MGGNRRNTASEYLSLYEIYSKEIERYAKYKGNVYSGLTEQEASEKIAELKAERAHIVEYIQSLRGIKRKVLYMRYIEGKDLKTVAAELDKSYGYVRHICAEGLAIIEKRLQRV